MIKVNILVNDTEDQLEASLDSASASLADLTICERMLRRYLDQVIARSNEILDKDTKREGKKEKKVIPMKIEGGGPVKSTRPIAAIETTEADNVDLDSN